MQRGCNLEEKKPVKEKLIENEKVDFFVAEKKPLNISDVAEKADSDLQKIAPVSDNEALKTKSASKKWLIALLFITVNLLAILLTAVIEFIGDEQPIHISKVWGTFMQNWVWAVGALVLIALSIFFEAVKRFVFLRSTLKKNMPIISLNSTIICKYYDNITPLGAGGQPFEIYYLRKKGLPVGISSGVPLVSYSLNKIAYFAVSFSAICINGFGETGIFIKILCLLGLFINLIIPAAIVMFALMPKFSSAIAHGVANIGKKLHLVKDREAFFKKTTSNFIEYADCINYFLRKSKISIAIGFLCSVAYFITMYSLPYFTIRMSGNHNVNWGEMFTYCVICYASITLLPTPGSSGGAELSFRSIFDTYLSGGLLFWGMLSWRIFSYYSFIILGIILIIAQQILKFTKNDKADKKAEKPAPIEPEDELEPYSPVPPTFKTEDADIYTTAEQLSIAEATLEPEIQKVEEAEIINIDEQKENVETVVEFTAVIESKSTVTITDEHIEHIEHVKHEHQISIDELTATTEENAKEQEPITETTATEEIVNDAVNQNVVTDSDSNPKD